MTREPVRLALIGSGKMGAVHARNVAEDPDAALVAVAGGSRAEELAGRHGADLFAVEEVFGRRPLCWSKARSQSEGMSNRSRPAHSARACRRGPLAGAMVHPSARGEAVIRGECTNFGQCLVHSSFVVFAGNEFDDVAGLIRGHEALHCVRHPLVLGLDLGDGLVE